MNLAVIPARGGSKRIPGKNVRNFCGRPMIAWAIEAARGSGLFAHVVVSTDNDQIASVAAQWGADVPFRRPVELADDYATTDAVLHHALDECTTAYGVIEGACCIYPTSPFLQSGDLAEGLRLLEAHRATSAFPVVRFDFPLEQAFRLDGVRPRPRWPGFMNARSQDLVEYYHDAGLFYWCAPARYGAAGSLHGEDSVAFVLPSDRCQDINTEEDWRRAELKFRIFREVAKV